MGYERTTNQPPILTKDLQRAPLKKQKYKNKLCEANKKYSFVSGAPGDENKSHADVGGGSTRGLSSKTICT